MRNNINGGKRGFRHIGAAWYAKTALAVCNKVDRVMVGIYHDGGGTSGEFSIVWEHLAGKITPKLVAYDDSWNALHHFADVLSKMAGHAGEDMGPEALCSLLLDCGVEDLTEREDTISGPVTQNIDEQR